MSLYDVSGGGSRLITPGITSNIYVEAHERNNSPADRRNVMRHINTGIDAALVERIAWTKAGIMWGYDSVRPHKDVVALWDSISKIVGTGKDAAIMLGCLFRYAMARRPETHWLCLTTTTNKLDPLTLKPIKVTEYWLNKTFKAPMPKVSTIDDLRAKLCVRL
jgi:hypothetical protein